MLDKNYHNKSAKTVLADLKSGINGLTIKEVEKRRAKHGLNKLIEQKKVSKIFIFFSQFHNILIYVLILASLISFFFQ